MFYRDSVKLQVLLDSDIDHPVNAGQILKRTNINGTYKKGGRKGIYASIVLIMVFLRTYSGRSI